MNDENKQGENTVELIECSGSDLGHALSAWTSTSRDLTPEKIARVPALLKKLAEEGHHTPFEKSYFRFLVNVDTATHIHLLKHRIGTSINGESARYKELKDDKFYVPHDWSNEDKKQYCEFVEYAQKQYHDMLNKLVASGVSRKRAKEAARFYLPYGNQLTLDVSFNFRSFMHFQKLRNSDHAQEEVHEVAQKMLDLVKNEKVFEHSLTAFGY